MADYNIYIHAIGNSGATNENPTVPWSAREGVGNANPTASQTSGGVSGGGGLGAAYMVTKGATMLSNPNSIVGGAAAGVMKYLPAVAAAYAVVKIGITVVNKATEFAEIQGGDYSKGIDFRNFQQAINNITSSFSSVIQNYKTHLEWEVQNQKSRMQRDLLGDSVINSYTNRGV